MTPHRWLLAITLFVLALQACPAQAMFTEELGLAVGAVSFNEGLDNQDDLGLIWTVTEGHSATDRGRLRWLQCHSSKVLQSLEARPCLRPPKTCPVGRNCQWTRNLTEDGAEPLGWPHSAAYWRVIMRPRWLVHLERARALVSGRKRHRPCPGAAPFSWGGRDSLGLLELGWTRVVCGDAANSGYRRP